MTATPNPVRSGGAYIDIMSANLAQNWWAVALRGVAGILFGVIALLMPGAAILSLLLLFAGYLVVDAVFAIVSAVRAARRHERWMMLVLQAVVGLFAAAVALLWPGLTVVASVLLIAAWSVVSGVLSLAAAVSLRKDHGRIWLVIGGIASILFGMLLIVAPLMGAIVLTWWMGAWALVLGLSLLVLAFRLHAHRGDDLHAAVPAKA